MKTMENKWISVKDRLPEVGVIVHVWRRNSLTTAKRVQVGETDLWHFDGEYRYTYEEPTLWQPFPEPPNSQTGNI